MRFAPSDSVGLVLLFPFLALIHPLMDLDLVRDDPIPYRIGERLRDNIHDDFEKAHRFLLIFAPSDEDAGYREQLSALEADRADWRSRDLIIVSIFLHEGGQAGDRVIEEADAAALRRKYAVEQPVEVLLLLIDKDGRTTLRAEAPMTAERLRDRIDHPPEAPPTSPPSPTSP